VPLALFRTFDVGHLTLGLAFGFGPLMCFFAFPLVAFRTLSISIHATLQCSNPHVSSPREYLTVERRLRECQARSTALRQPTAPAHSG
jgi:hypothetical protein